jgi:hypothetical protein
VSERDIAVALPEGSVTTLDKVSRAEVEGLAAKLRYSIARSPENSGMVQVELEDVKQWIAIRQNRDELASEPYVVSRSCFGTDRG